MATRSWPDGDGFVASGVGVVVGSNTRSDVPVIVSEDVVSTADLGKDPITGFGRAFEGGRGRSSRSVMGRRDGVGLDSTAWAPDPSLTPATSVWPSVEGGCLYSPREGVQWQLRLLLLQTFSWLSSSGCTVDLGSQQLLAETVGLDRRRTLIEALAGTNPEYDTVLNARRQETGLPSAYFAPGARAVPSLWGLTRGAPVAATPLDCPRHLCSGI